MQTETQELDAICSYLNDLGLGGSFQLIGGDESLKSSLGNRFGNRLRIGVPESAESLEHCSVLLLDAGKDGAIGTTLELLMRTEDRPLVVVLGEADLSTGNQQQLSALGYQLPGVQAKDCPLLIIEHAELGHKKYFDVAGYWEKRYATGKNSGSGSYGRLAQFKAQFLNDFVRENDIQTVLELGCGDGAQLSLAEYPEYTGLDISPTVIEQCEHVFAKDASKQFHVYDPQAFDADSFRAELGLSLDVIYHLSNDDVYRDYLNHLFAVSSRFVIVYSNSEQGSRAGVNASASYVRFRNVLDDLRQLKPEWSLVSATPNRFPFSVNDPSHTSFADFFVFERKQNESQNILSGDELTRFYTKKILNTLVVSDENAKRLFEGVSEANKNIGLLSKGDRSGKILDNIAEVNNKVGALAGAEVANSIHQKISDTYSKLDTLVQDNDASQISADVSLANQKLNTLIDKIQKLDEERQVKAELKEVSQKYNDLSARFKRDSQKIEVLEAELEDTQARYRTANYKYRHACRRIEKLKVVEAEVLDLNSQMKRELNKNNRLSADKAALDRQLSVLKKSARYQLGYHLVRAAQSWRAMLALPLAFYRVAKRRKSAKNNPANNRAVTSEPSAPEQNAGGPAPAKPTPTASEISILGWPEYPPNGKPYVIGVMDEFTSGCFEQDLNLIQPRPDNWHALADKYKPELIFIESAWKGNSGSWQYRVGDYANKPGPEVEQLCQYAREKGIPTLFWNKEDPVHHDKFMCSARLVDHIFTTDANMKESYQAKTGNSNVHALPFAAQPALHKPAPLAGRKPRACFAGSWYGNRHAERGEAMGWLLQAANAHGLDIYDRNHGTGIFPFPEEYQAGIKGSLPYKELCNEYSRYRVFLNVNSVTDSPTMFSRRVFELMACGTPVVSTYARGIENLFESGAVWLVNSQQEADEAIRTLMTDDAEWRRRSLAGIREVFARHTYAHRLNNIFEKLGMETRLSTDPAIALVAEAQSHAELEALDRFAHQQSYRSFRLGIACAPGLAGTAGPVGDTITLLQPGEQTTWLADRQAEASLAGWISPGNQYGEHYLRDLANASLYEPEACGWAKALDQDRFAYSGQASMSGSVWQMSEFLAAPVKSGASERLSRSDLYLADSDHFQLAGTAKQAEEG
ncbi:glycosyltransferase [Marinobacter lacisalsi]|uniref:Glycosyltransferase n=1 Tax=Marinobacter lacisalsi TaxID=475979 RepID=A0ABV8QIA8_9GAMM